MLKKAGIVVAAAAASLLAVSPLAFAGEKGHDSWGSHHAGSPDQVNSISDLTSQRGLVNVGDVNALNNLAVCSPINAAIPVSVLGILGGNQGVDQTAGNVVCAPGDSTTQVNED
ncbi:MAG: hypothetical protein OJJ54_21300 [Pseudonocardia sp.]|nr:hypothetical protein [Pseudonocardia sp.]